jgi:hypothetical protein
VRDAPEIERTVAAFAHSSNGGLIVTGSGLVHRDLIIKLAAHHNLPAVYYVTLGGAATAWPLAARAQQRERMLRIGGLLPVAADDVEFQARVGAFLQALALLGWTIGRNVRIDTRWAGACRRHSQTRGGIGRARAYRLGRGASAAGDPFRADRFRAGHRSGRRWFCRQRGAAGGQCNGLYNVRIQHER